MLRVSCRLTATCPGGAARSGKGLVLITLNLRRGEEGGEERRGEGRGERSEEKRSERQAREKSSDAVGGWRKREGGGEGQKGAGSETVRRGGGGGEWSRGVRGCVGTAEKEESMGCM